MSAPVGSRCDGLGPPGARPSRPHCADDARPNSIFWRLGGSDLRYKHESQVSALQVSAGSNTELIRLMPAWRRKRTESIREPRRSTFPPPHPEADSPLPASFSRLSCSPSLNPASPNALEHGKAIRHRLLDEWHVRYQANGSARSYDVLENLKDTVQCAAVVLRVQTSEALVDEDGVEADRAVTCLNDV